MKIDDVEKFKSILNKCILNPNLESCVVGRALNKKTDKQDWYYEFVLIHGYCQQERTKYRRVYFRALEENELVSDIFKIVGGIGFPFIFNFKKAKFIKQIEMAG
jgi:hypothetical protein